MQMYYYYYYSVQRGVKEKTETCFTSAKPQCFERVILWHWTLDGLHPEKTKQAKYNFEIISQTMT